MTSTAPAIVIKQGAQSAPHHLPPAQARTLRALLRRAGAAARAHAASAEESARIRTSFEALRPAVEAAHALTRTYSVTGAGGEIQVTLGTEFVLSQTCADPFALRSRLEALGRLDLLAHFCLEARPDQRAVKDHACRELEAVGALQEKRPVISLRAGEAAG